MTDALALALRTLMRQVREHLSPHYQQAAAQKICNQIYHLEAYRSANHIALYRTIRGEIDLHPLWLTSCKAGKTCYFPILNQDKTLSFFPANLQTKFKKNKFGIAEPSFKKNKKIEINSLDLMLLPLVAFDKKGTRLGMGGGYYDRSLTQASKPPLLVGVAYDFQAVVSLQAKPWDIPLDAIITPEKIQWSDKKIYS